MLLVLSTTACTYLSQADSPLILLLLIVEMKVV